MTPNTRIWICILPAVAVPFIASVLYFWVFPEARIAWWIYSSTKLFLIAWPPIAVLGIEGGRPRFERSDIGRHLRAIPLGLATGAAIGGVGLILFFWTPVGDYVRAHSDAIVGKVAELKLFDRFVLFATVISLIHSLVEEYYWRWFVFGRMVKVLRPGWAYFLGGAAFASFHYVVLSRYFPLVGTAAFGTLVGIGGAIWCWMYRYQKSLVGCWLSHVVVDAAIFFIGYRLVFG
jgi:membrane protease YdiL (CAAX protease family)